MEHLAAVSILGWVWYVVLIALCWFALLVSAVCLIAAYGKRYRRPDLEELEFGLEESFEPGADDLLSLSEKETHPA